MILDKKNYKGTQYIIDFALTLPEIIDFSVQDFLKASLLIMLSKNQSYDQIYQNSKDNFSNSALLLVKMIKDKFIEALQ